MFCKISFMSFYHYVSQLTPCQDVVSIYTLWIDHNEDHDESLNGTAFRCPNNLFLAFERNGAKVGNLSKLPGRGSLALTWIETCLPSSFDAIISCPSKNRFFLTSNNQHSMTKSRSKMNSTGFSFAPPMLGIRIQHRRPVCFAPYNLIVVSRSFSVSPML